jgi:hypothetical protein
VTGTPPEPAPAEDRLALLRVATLPFAALEGLAAPAAVARCGEVLEQEERLDAGAASLSDALHAAAGEPPGKPGKEDTDPERARRRLAVIALRRDLHNRRNVPPARLAEVRSALAPELFAAVEDHLAGRVELARREAEYARAFAAGLGDARRALLALAADPLFREGVRLVSRSLLERLRAMDRLDPARRPFRHAERHALAKLAAYAARFATKTSPNAVFCATALARIGGSAARVAGTNLPLRLDALISVAEARKISACLGSPLTSGRAVWPAVVPRANPTLTLSDGVWSFWRPSSLRRDDDDEVLSRTRAQDVLDLFFEEAGRGTLAVPALLAAVAARYEVEVEELVPFFEQLAAKGILIAEIEPPYNCRRPLRFVADAMRQAGADAPWLAAVEAAEREVDALPALAPEERLAALDRLEKGLAALPHHRALHGDELLRIDAASGLAVTLPEHLRADLELPLRRYVRLFAALYPELAFRHAWAARFRSRHPADVDLPLLDLYHGTFEPETAERPEAFPAAPPGEERAAALLERTAAWFAARARTALAAGHEEVALTDEDWETLVDGLPEPFWSAGALFQIAARDPGEIAAGRYRIVLNALFGAGIALARFAHLHGGADPEAADNPVTREVARSWETLARGTGSGTGEQTERVFAEISYNHFARSANAGLRPVLFRHEIELPGDRATPGVEVIPLREMTVRWDTAEERFILRWPARGVEVVPVISSGVSPEGFVSFLVEIGRQGQQPLAWFPGFDVPGVTAWPRFTSGRVVLFRRRWICRPGPQGDAPEPPAEAGDPDAEAAIFFARVQRWRRRHALPRRVFLHTPQEPKPFFADLDSPLSADLLRRLLLPTGESGAPPALHVTEMLPGPDGLWATDEAGRYASEILLHLTGPA